MLNVTVAAALFRRTFFRRTMVRRLASLALLALALTAALTLSVGPAAAQSQQPTGPAVTSVLDGKTLPGQAPGSPLGSYELSGFDNINLYNGNLNFALPLLHIGGRGAAGATIYLPFNTKKWTIHHLNCNVPTQGSQSPPACFDQQGNPIKDAYFPAYAWWAPVQPGYGPGVMYSRTSGRANPNTCACNDTSQPLSFALTRFTFIASDGTEYEFRDVQANDFGHLLPVGSGEPPCQTSNFGPCAGTATCGCSGTIRGRTYVTTDGSHITFVTTDNQGNPTDVRDPHASGFVGFATGFMMFPDGSRYFVVDGNVMWIRDRNGNQVTFTYDNSGGAGPGRVTQITDSLGRTVNIFYGTFVIGPDGNPVPQPTPVHDTITFSGFGGAVRKIHVYYGYLHDTLSAAAIANGGVQDIGALFPTLDAHGTTFDPFDMVQKVDLPDQGLEYSFKYDQFGELARVDLPTGGAFEYDTQLVSVPTDPLSSDKSPYFRVTERRVYPDGHTLEGKTDYSATTAVSGSLPIGSGQSINTYTTTVTVTHLDISGHTVAAENHLFNGDPTDSLEANFYLELYPWWSDGKEVETDDLAADGKTVLRKKIDDWQQTTIFWYQGFGPDFTAPSNDPILADTKEYLMDGSPTLVSKETYQYDQYNNVTDKFEHDYGQGSPGALLRHVHTDYVTTLNGTAYDTVNPNVASPSISATVHIRDLPADVITYDGLGNRVAETDFEYDNYNSDGNHAALLPDSGILGLDANFTTSYTTRGNVTATMEFLNSPAKTITSYDQFDVAGNVVARIDPLGRKTTIVYAAGDQYARPNEEDTPVPDPLGQQGSKSALIRKAAYDFSTGSLTSFTDVNGNVTTLGYNDVLDRLTNVAKPDGGSTAYSYTDQPNAFSIQSTIAQDGSSNIITTSHFDGLGRSVERDLAEGASVIATTMGYDAMGRVSQTSNPYRPQTESAALTTTAYDILGRVSSVTTPDGAVVSTFYNNNQTLVQDQAGAERMSQLDALGRLTNVWEITSTDSSRNYGTVDSITFPGHSEVSKGYETIYGYDALDDLISVSQGSQSRSFTYDSLKRLLTANNPENGQITYSYDDASNLHSKTDGRTTVTNTYDALDRLISRTYSDSTPAVTLFYDGTGLPTGVTVPNGIGNRSAVKSSVSESDYLKYDPMGRILSYQQQTLGQTYGSSYVYNLAGALTDETYPSGKSIHTDYDSAGRVAGVKNSATQAYYAGAAATDTANSIQYASQGAIAKMKLGNGLWETNSYNNRLQPTKMQLGASAGSSSLLELDFGFGGAANNGNVLSQTIAYGAPSLTTIGVQNYSYDALNRLSSAQEMNGSTTAWQQTYVYDRYGNRSVLAGSYMPSATLTPQANNATDLSAFDAGTNKIAALLSTGYDGSGNQTKDLNGNSFVYDANNLLSTFTAAVGGATAGYAYDGNGDRVTKTVNGSTTVFVYNAMGNLIAEYGGPASNGGTSYLTTDHLGSTRVVTNANGGVVSRHDYIPFGEEIPLGIGARTPSLNYEAADDTRQKFTSKERDTESGWDCFDARYFSPPEGRFTSPDEFSGGPVEAFAPTPSNGVRQPLPYAEITDPRSLNKYCYGYDAPIVYVDPNGHDGPFEGIKQLINLMLGGGVSRSGPDPVNRQIANQKMPGQNGATLQDCLNDTFKENGKVCITLLKGEEQLPYGFGLYATVMLNQLGERTKTDVALAMIGPFFGAISKIKEDAQLTKLAIEAGEADQKGIDSLTAQLAKGNLNPGIGTKNLFGDIFYARGKNGARVFFRPVKNGIEILAKAAKKNESQVIARLIKLYGK